LRRISQMGLSSLVYPGARHSRFEHALGAMHLMNKTVETLQRKHVAISDEEKEALAVAILLHDIGHGPFSHAIERTIFLGVNHELLSLGFMELLNKEFDGKLSLAISIYANKYRRKFMHQLVSSQLDIDRLDYLKRDSFYTGATEGNINSHRIIEMLNVVDDQVVVEENGLFSIEKFIMARRLMYWQVYLHKTVVSAENMLIKTLQRAKELLNDGKEVYANPYLGKFLKNNYTIIDFENNTKLLNNFAELDDFDIYSSLKYWKNNPDFVLSSLSKMILNRNLLKIKVQNTAFTASEIETEIDTVKKSYNISKQEAEYFIFSDKVSNSTYNIEKATINILMKNGDVIDITSASGQFNIEALKKTINKYFLCYSKLK